MVHQQQKLKENRLKKHVEKCLKRFFLLAINKYRLKDNRLKKMGPNQLTPRPSSVTNRMTFNKNKRIPPYPCRVEGWLHICGKCYFVHLFILFDLSFHTLCKKNSCSVVSLSRISIGLLFVDCVIPILEPLRMRLACLLCKFQWLISDRVEWVAPIVRFLKFKGERPPHFTF